MQIGRWLISKGLEKSAAKPGNDDPAISDMSEGPDSGAVSGMSGHFSTADGPPKSSVKSNGRATGKTTSLLSRCTQDLCTAFCMCCADVESVLSDLVVR